MVTASVVLWPLQPGLISFLSAISGHLGLVSKLKHQARTQYTAINTEAHECAVCREYFRELGPECVSISQGLFSEEEAEGSQKPEGRMIPRKPRVPNTAGRAHVCTHSD